jgi:hypothetical protein
VVVEAGDEDYGAARAGRIKATVADAEREADRFRKIQPQFRYSVHPIGEPVANPAPTGGSVVVNVTEGPIHPPGQCPNCLQTPCDGSGTCCTGPLGPEPVTQGEREALAPFAKYAAALEDCDPTDAWLKNVDDNGNCHVITVGDFLRAAAALRSPEPVRPGEREALLRAAMQALRSYQYGNASPELAEEIADSIESALRSPESTRSGPGVPVESETEGEHG